MTGRLPQLLFPVFRQLDQWLAPLLAVVAALVLLWLLQRAERRLVSGAVAAQLLMLRACVLLLALLVLWQPTLRWTSQRQRSSQILVGVDVSDSMSTVDLAATNTERLHWARALGLVRPEAPQWTEWLAAAERADADAVAEQAALQPAAVPADPAPQEAVPAVALPPAGAPAGEVGPRKIADENLRDLLDQVAQLSRRELTERVLRLPGSAWRDKLAQLAMVSPYVFAGDVAPVEADVWADAVARPDGTLRTGQTDLTRALAASGRPGLRSRAVVLLTDGRDHADGDVLQQASTLQSLGIPIYPVIVGTTQTALDLSIIGIDAPPAVYEGDQPRVRVLLGGYGFEGSTAALETVMWTGESDTPGPDDKPEVVDTREVTFTGGTTSVELTLPKRAAGRYRYRVRLPHRPRETRADNNTRSFSIQVVDDRSRVLLVDQTARWEFRYLQDALVRDERIVLNTILFDQPFVGALDAPYFSTTFPDKEAPLWNELDLAILGDVSPEHLSEAQWEQIERFVADQGGTLVLSAGKRYLPEAHRSDSLDRLLPVLEVAPFVPVGAAEREPIERGLPLQPTAEANLLPALQLVADPEENRRQWSRLAGPSWLKFGRPKPGASPWITTLLPAAANLNEQRERAVIVHQHYGLGQVIWIGMDSTWRWRFRAGDRWHHRFWGQLARWAAQSKAAAGNDLVRFGIDRSDVRLGEEVLARARWTRAFLAKFPQARPRAAIYPIAGNDPRPVAAIDLVASASNSLVYEGRSSSLPPGEYRVRLEVEEGDLGPEPIETRLTVSNRLSSELTDLSANLDLLQGIATASGGKVLQLDDLPDLADLLRVPEDIVEQATERTLWDHYGTLVAISLLLTTEWVLRKRHGLP